MIDELVGSVGEIAEKESELGLFGMERERVLVGCGEIERAGNSCVAIDIILHSHTTSPAAQRMKLEREARFGIWPHHTVVSRTLSNFHRSLMRCRFIVAFSLLFYFFIRSWTSFFYKEAIRTVLLKAHHVGPLFFLVKFHN